MACSADLGRTIHTSGLLIRANCMRRMHHVQGEADDVTGLLIAATHGLDTCQSASYLSECMSLLAHRLHYMRGGADDVTGLLTAALTASIHASRL